MGFPILISGKTASSYWISALMFFFSVSVSKCSCTLQSTSPHHENPHPLETWIPETGQISTLNNDALKKTKWVRHKIQWPLFWQMTFQVYFLKRKFTYLYLSFPPKYPICKIALITETFSHKKVNWKMLSLKWQPCCLSLNVLGNRFLCIIKQIAAFPLQENISKCLLRTTMFVNPLRLSNTYMQQ